MKRCFILLLLSSVLTLLAAQTPQQSLDSLLDAFLSKEQQTVLLQEGRLLRSVYNEENAMPIFTPPFAVPQAFASSWDKGKPSFLIEALYLYKKADSTHDVGKLSRILRSVSKLTGLQYYSSSRKKMRTLYEASYVIDDPKRDAPQSDPVDNPAGDFSVYVVQKDLTFDKNIYRYRFCADADSSGFLSTNHAVLKYSVFKAIEAESLVASIAVTDIGDYLLIHALTRAQFTAPSIFRERVQNSFRTRGEAVYGWFITQYEAVPDTEDE